jgi:hypothetical protein
VDEEIIIGQMSLLLQQVRFARLALEDVERNTARYAGIALSVGGSGTPLGAPPLQNGALRVYVINLEDLAGGSGIGDVLGGLLGGAGRFIGGLIGGTVGGVVGGVTMPVTIFKIAAITENIAEIMRRLGAGEAPSQGSSSEGSSLLSQLDRIDKTLDRVAFVLGAATSDPTKVRDGESAAERERRLETYRIWMGLALQVGHAIDGAVLLLPILTGALASFLNKIPDLQVLLLDFVEFAVRNVLRLRAVVLALVVDTVDVVAKLAAAILVTLSKLVDDVLGSVFLIVEAALVAAFTILRTLGPGLKATLDQLVNFLTHDVANALNTLGSTSVFQIVASMVQTLPLVIPALARLKGTPLSDKETEALTDAVARARPASRASLGRNVGAPDFERLASVSNQRAAVTELENLGRTMRSDATNALGAANRAVADINRTVQDGVAGMDASLQREISTRVGEADRQSTSLARAMSDARSAGGNLPQLEQVAGAYERWLTGGGLNTLMQRLETHFTSGAGATRAAETLLAPARDAASAAAPPAVRVEIDSFNIRIGAPGQGARPGRPARTTRTRSLDPMHDDLLDRQTRAGVK